MDNDPPKHSRRAIIAAAALAAGCGKDKAPEGKNAPTATPAPVAPPATKPRTVDKNDRLVICYGKEDADKFRGCHTVIVHQGNFEPHELGNVLSINKRLRGSKETLVAGYLSATQLADWEKDKYPELLKESSIVLRRNNEWKTSVLNVTHPSWLMHEKAIVADVKHAGANAIFIDNVDDVIDQADKKPQALNAFKSLLKECEKQNLKVLLNRGFDGPSRTGTKELSGWIREKLVGGIVVESGNPAQQSAATQLKQSHPNLTLYAVSYPLTRTEAEAAYKSDREAGFIPYHPHDRNMQRVEAEPNAAKIR